MSLDFKILEVEMMPGVLKVNGEPAYQVVVQSHFNNNIYRFDNRFGSFLTSKTDSQGRRKEPVPHLAAAMVDRVQKKSRADSKNEPTLLKENPFLTI